MPIEQKNPNQPEMVDSSRTQSKCLLNPYGRVVPSCCKGGGCQQEVFIFKRKFNCSLVSNKITCFISFLQSTPESLFVHHAQMNLLPSHTYSNNSGGDPLCIPDLTVSACIMAIEFFWDLNLYNAWPIKLLLMAVFTLSCSC